MDEYPFYYNIRTGAAATPCVCRSLALCTTCCCANDDGGGGFLCPSFRQIELMFPCLLVDVILPQISRLMSVCTINTRRRLRSVHL